MKKEKSPFDITMLKNCILNHFLRDTMCTDLIYHLNCNSESTEIPSYLWFMFQISDHIWNQWKQLFVTCTTVHYYFFYQCSVRENYDSLWNHGCMMGLSPTLVYLTALLSRMGFSPTLVYLTVLLSRMVGLGFIWSIQWKYIVPQGIWKGSFNNVAREQLKAKYGS